MPHELGNELSGVYNSLKSTGLGRNGLSNLCKLEDIGFTAGRWVVELCYLRSCFDGTWTRRILTLPALSTTSDDELYWTLNKTGEYDFKSGYVAALMSFMETISTRRNDKRVHSSCSSFFRKFLWRLPGPYTWRIFLWKILSECLPVKEEMARRGLPEPYYCPVCKDPSSYETANHLFRECSFA